MENAKYLQIEACVRYWEDAEINGESKEDGSNVPFKDGRLWRPIIDIESGYIIDWPIGTFAIFHFKVCDAGIYHLLNDKHQVIASRFDNYVPEGVCHGDEGYGDYIIFKVDENGFILGYKNKIDFDEFES